MKLCEKEWMYAVTISLFSLPTQDEGVEGGTDLCSMRYSVYIVWQNGEGSCSNPVYFGVLTSLAGRVHISVFIFYYDGRWRHLLRVVGNTTIYCTLSLLKPRIIPL